jgi:HAD superfamily hydrolase (TIGR01484 family)
MNQKNKYKALIIDVDGTLVPNKPDGKPSNRVKQAIVDAQSVLHVGIASGRPLFLLTDIINDLSLSGPSIILGGSKIVDSQTKHTLWEKGIPKKDVKEILQVFTQLNMPLYYDEDFGEKQITSSNIPNMAFSLYSGRVSISPEKAQEIIDKLSHIPSVTPHIVPGWEFGVAVNITHAEATKQHGIFEVAKLLNIETSEIIGVGDGGNDLPLLMACGFRVAMGNAGDDLKAIADYIAPSVEDDGVADVIERFILPKK